MTVGGTARTAQREALIALRPNAGARIRTVCLPFAGGGSQVYRDCPAQLPGDVQLLAFEPPGRGRRFGEPPLCSVASMADAVVDALGSIAPPFALFGHSLGARVAFETAHRLAARQRPLPARRLLSAAGAPGTERRPPVHALPDAEFVAALRRLNGTPAEVLAHAELMEIVMPVLRADFAAAETWTFDAGRAPPLAVPITVFGGTEDDVPRAALEAWRPHTTGAFAVHLVPGDHFFVQGQQAAALPAHVARELDAAGR